ncbi:hypothetical protein A5630_15545 [Mycolicibacterium mucogenicum]|uniref:AB hydrolase-1 domain-containing protein n=1 Tax=Mycolicibacterium mucogenicum TaxID=56689 RepID=A0A1A3HAW9_MYCMU|nr:alpha/beta hydrolase [Mycolicibacterium mucogenicum]OBJ44819.1 hypothetical protein A5630_15545 [Mycolicibacterium mucogenicum]
MRSAAAVGGLHPQHVHVDRAQVQYFDVGEARDDRLPVVLLHGTGGNTNTHFSFLLPMLSARQRVVSIDFSPNDSSGLEVSDLEAQLVAVLETLHLDRCTLVGYSLGAVVAASVAGHRPELVSNLILIAGWMRTDAHQLLRNDVWRLLESIDHSAAQRFSVLAAYSPSFLQQRSPVEREGLIRSVQIDEFRDAQMDLNRRIDLSDTVRGIEAQTLIIGCRDDFMAPTHHSKQLFGAITNARYTEIASGHAVVTERPAELVHWIDTFNKNPHKYPVGKILENPRP